MITLTTYMDLVEAAGGKGGWGGLSFEPPLTRWILSEIRFMYSMMKIIIYEVNI